MREKEGVEGRKSATAANRKINDATGQKEKVQGGKVASKGLSEVREWVARVAEDVCQDVSGRDSLCDAP